MYDDGLSTPTTHNFVAGPGASGLTAEYNKGITPIFMNRPIPDPAKTASEGRPMFKNEELAILLIAGDPHNQVAIEMRVAEERFPDHYRKWKEKNVARHVDGTPLRSWPVLSPLEVAEFEALNIFNVEGLAAIPDSSVNRTPSLRSWRSKAQAYITNAKDGAAYAKLAEENETLRRDMEELKAQFAQLSLRAEKRR